MPLGWKSTLLTPLAPNLTTDTNSSIGKGQDRPQELLDSGLGARKSGRIKGLFGKIKLMTKLHSTASRDRSGYPALR